MDWNFDELDAAKRYKLMVGLVVPRPIAWITTRNRDGVVNAAPFSYFNMLSNDPPIVVVSIENRNSGPMKDTARNILDSGEFVVNLVDEEVAERMHVSSGDFPPGVSEVEKIGLHTAPSRCVAPPRLAEAPVSLECKLRTQVDFDAPHIFIGQVHWLHVREGIVDPATLRIRFDRYFPVGRLFANLYTRTREHFAIAVDEAKYPKPDEARK